VTHNFANGDSLTHSPQSLATLTLRLKGTLLSSAATHRREGHCARRRAREARRRARDARLRARDARLRARDARLRARDARLRTRRPRPDAQDPRRSTRHTTHDRRHSAHWAARCTPGRHTAQPTAQLATPPRPKAPLRSAPNSAASVKLNTRAPPAVNPWIGGAAQRSSGTS
jgi:hypothetical protein